MLKLIYRRRGQQKCCYFLHVSSTNEVFLTVGICNSSARKINEYLLIVFTDYKKC